MNQGEAVDEGQMLETNQALHHHTSSTKGLRHCLLREKLCEECSLGEGHSRVCLKKNPSNGLKERVGWLTPGGRRLEDCFIS